MTSRTPEEQAELERICDEDDERARRLLRERAAASIGGDAWVRDWLAGVTEASNRFAAALETAAASCSYSPEQLRHFVARVGWSGPKFIAAVEDGTWRHSLRAALARDQAEYLAAAEGAVALAIGEVAPALARLPEDTLRGCIADPRLLRWAEGWGGDTGAILIGATAKGKTSAAVLGTRRIVTTSWIAARERALAADRGWSPATPPQVTVRWASALELTDAERRHPLGEGLPPIVQGARTAPVLVLDDVGWERTPDAILGVLAARYARGAPTVLTSGLRWTELVRRYGEAALRRPLQAGGKAGAVVDCWPPQKGRQK